MHTGTNDLECINSTEELISNIPILISEPSTLKFSLSNIFLQHFPLNDYQLNNDQLISSCSRLHGVKFNKHKYPLTYQTRILHYDNHILQKGILTKNLKDTIHGHTCIRHSWPYPSRNCDSNDDGYAQRTSKWPALYTVMSCLIQSCCQDHSTWNLPFAFLPSNRTTANNSYHTSTHITSPNFIVPAA